MIGPPKNFSMTGILPVIKTMRISFCEVRMLEDIGDVKWKMNVYKILPKHVVDVVLVWMGRYLKMTRMNHKMIEFFKRPEPYLSSLFERWITRHCVHITIYTIMVSGVVLCVIARKVYTELQSGPWG